MGRLEGLLGGFKPQKGAPDPQFEIAAGVFFFQPRRCYLMFRFVY